MEKENLHGDNEELRTEKGNFLFLLLGTSVYLVVFSSFTVYSIRYLIGFVIIVLPNFLSSSVF